MTWVASGGGIAVTIPGGAQVEGPVAGPVVRVGDAAQALPASILPAHGTSLPALTQESPPDIVSGWVRLWIAGFLADRPGWDGVICALQGDVSHWLRISADEIVSCASFLTPRLIASLGGTETDSSAEAVADSLSRPERLAAYLRAAEVTGETARLTGHLIGAELAAARPYWLGQQIAVIGETALMHIYAHAIAAQGCPVARATVAEILPIGLAALADRLQLQAR